MTRFRACAAVAAAVAVVGGAWLLTAQGPERDPAPTVAATPAGPARSAARSSGPRTGDETPAAGPPAGTAGLAQSYLAHYQARRVDWDDVLAHGKPLPRPDARCKASWNTSGKDSRLAWSGGDYWCLAGLPGRAWKPQGISGSGSTEGYAISSRAAGGRNIVLTSWYSRAAEKGLFAPNRSGQSVTRLVVIDLDRARYNTVELVRPDGSSRLRNLNSHGSGLAWAGQYLYSSSRSWLWMYNADDLLQIDGHFVLPAVTRWSVSGLGGLSSISVDRSSGRSQLVAINFTRTGPSRVHAFDLTRRGLLATRAGTLGESLQLATGFGEKRRVVRSVTWRTVPGAHYQGVGRWGRYTFANSSSLQTRPGGPRSNAMLVLQDATAVQRFRMPRGNVESVYVDQRRRSYASLTEDDSQFLFVLPLREVVTKALR